MSIAVSTVRSDLNNWFLQIRRSLGEIKKIFHQCGKFVPRRDAEKAHLSPGAALEDKCWNACDSQAVRLLFIAHKVFRFQVEFV